MKYWKCKFEAQKGHPDYNAVLFEREKIVVVQSKFKGEARELAEEALKIWDHAAPDKYRVPIIEQATDLEADQYQRKLTVALHSTEQTGGTLNSSGEVTDTNNILLNVYDFPVCDPYSIFIGVLHDETHNDYRYSVMLSDRIENKVIDGDLSYLSDTAYENVSDAINLGLTEAVTAIEESHAELFGAIHKPSIQILKGYRTLNEKQQLDQFAYTLELEASPEVNEPHDVGNPSNNEGDLDESCANTNSEDGETPDLSSLNGTGQTDFSPHQEPDPTDTQDSPPYERRIYAAVQACVEKHLNKAPCPTVDDCAQNILAIIDALGFQTIDIYGLCKHIAEEIKNPFVLTHTTVSLNLVQSFQKPDEPDKQDTPDPLESIMTAVVNNPSSPQVPKDFDQRVYQNIKDLSDLYDLPMDSLSEHILAMEDISELYDFGRCEEIVGLYVNGKASSQEPAPSPNSLPSQDDVGEAVAALNVELNTLEVGQTIYKDNLPSQIYHAAIGISSTNLKEELISSEYRHNLETGEIERPSEHHFNFGNYIHTLLLQPELIETEYCFERELPEDGYTTIDSMKTVIQAHNEDTGDKVAVSGTKKELAERIRSFDPDAVFKHELDEEWQKEQDTGLIPVSLDDKDRGARIVQSAMENPAIRNWYAVNSINTKCERSYFTKIQIDLDGTMVELIVKARLDKEIGAFIIDTKTIELWRDVKEEDAENYLNREVEKRGYHLSAAHYLAVTGKTRFYWIFHNKLKGYEWEVIMEASEEHLMLGRFDREKALHSIAESMITGNYPPPVRQPLTPDGKPTPLMSQITRYGMKRLEDYHAALQEHQQGGYYNE